MALHDPESTAQEKALALKLGRQKKIQIIDGKQVYPSCATLLMKINWALASHLGTFLLEVSHLTKITHWFFIVSTMAISWNIFALNLSNFEFVRCCSGRSVDRWRGRRLRRTRRGRRGGWRRRGRRWNDGSWGKLNKWNIGFLHEKCAFSLSF